MGNRGDRGGSRSPAGGPTGSCVTGRSPRHSNLKGQPAELGRDAAPADDILILPERGDELIPEAGLRRRRAEL
jgi:hypothetical protein